MRELIQRQSWPEIYQHLNEDPLSQEAIGLVQEMVDTRKKHVMQNVSNTIDSIEEGFLTLVRLAQPGEKQMAVGTRASRRRKSQTQRHDDTKRQRKEEDQSSMSTSSSMSYNTSSDITDLSVSGEGIATPLKTSTPAHEPTAGCSFKSPETGTTRARSNEETAIEHLISHYCGMYQLQMSIGGSAYDVKCGDAKTLSYLSNMFYGLRNIFCHGAPEAAVVGAMRADRTPRKLSDLNIIMAEPDEAKELQTIEVRELCTNYLFGLFTKAKEQQTLMEVDYDLFLTGQSFYTYAVKVIGSVAACIAYRYGDKRLREKAELAVAREIQKIEADWKLVDAQINASKTSPSRIQKSLSVSGTEETVETQQQSTGLTQEFESM